jgi:DNA-binding transcriptional MerR regulator
MNHQGFLLAEICRVLDCRVHHIRYIEEHLPIISTAFDQRGRKVYSLKDVFLFSRILILMRGRGLGLQEALDLMIADLERPSLDMTARFLQIRHELLRTRLQSVQSANRLAMKYDASRLLPGWEVGANTGSGADHGAGENFERHFSPLGYFSRDLVLPGDSYASLEQKLSEYLDKPPDEPPDQTPVPPPDEAIDQPAEESQGFPDDADDAADILRRGAWALVTPDPYRNSSSYAGAAAVTPLRGLGLLEYMAEAVRAAANEYGAFPLWVIAVRRKNFHHLLGYLNSRTFFSLPPDRVVILPQPDYRGGSIGDTGALFSLRELVLDDLRAAGFRFAMIYSLEHPLIPLPDEGLVARLMSGRRGVLSAGILPGMAGELYFRLDERLGLRPVKTSPDESPEGPVNPALIQADTGKRGDIALVQSGREPDIVTRPHLWEFFPPLYRLGDWDVQVLTGHFLRTHRSWAGVPGGEIEISPLYARSRQEFRRRLGGKPISGGLFT